MKNLEKLYEKIETEEKLKKDIKKFNEEGDEILIIRAINDNELEELLQSGPSNFLFHKECGYMTFYRGTVEAYAEIRNGTVVTTQIKKEEISKQISDDVFGTCLVDFVAPVKVYNTRGLSWNDLEKNYISN